MTRSNETILNRILHHADENPDRIAWLQVAADGSTTSLSREDLVERAAGVAEALEAEGVHPGAIVALLIPHSEVLAVAWLGTLMHGAIPTILAEPSVRMVPAEYGKMLSHLLNYLAPAAVVVQGDRCQDAAKAADSVSGTRIIDVANMPPRGKWTGRRARSTDTAALQHSSGTTGQHKGVLMTNHQILDQVQSYARALNLDPALDKVASWLPLYHDMGFIACFVMPLVYGLETVQMSPFDWVARPWMLPVAVSATRATLSWLPNFAYHFLASRCTPLRLHGTDLSCWRQIINCSEPCTAAAFDRFYEHFAPYGVSRKAFGASYASAETIFAVSEGGVRRPLVVRHVDPHAFHAQAKLVDCVDGMPLVGCGTVIDGIEVEIRDEQFQAVLPDKIGEIWVTGPFLMQGYFRRSDLDAQVFYDGWYRTGDLGCIGKDGELYVTGRSKDLIIVGGINIPPQDIEQMVSELTGVIPGRAVVIGPWDKNLDTQRLVVLVESIVSEREERNRINISIRAAVATRTQVQVSDVRVFPRGTLRKSTSGKLSRRANLQLYEQGLSEEDAWANIGVGVLGEA
jgi:acyl-CoA synthetase (AMP-forming)/AMP-acid ligase II